MIVVDSSALIAIVLNEPEKEAFEAMVIIDRDVTSAVNVVAWRGLKTSPRERGEEAAGGADQDRAALLTAIGRCFSKTPTSRR